MTRTLQERSAGAAVTVLDMTKVSKMDFTSLENLVVRNVIHNSMPNCDLGFRYPMESETSNIALFDYAWREAF